MRHRHWKVPNCKSPTERKKRHNERSSSLKLTLLLIRGSDEVYESDCCSNGQTSVSRFKTPVLSISSVP